MRRWVGLIMALVAVVGIISYLNQHDPAGEAQSYRFAEVTRGDVRMIVASTGNVNPVTTVQVGSQISGQIVTLAADFNTPVKSGEVIARIDPASFEARAQAARAELAVARTNVSVQRATLDEFQADMMGAEAALLDGEQEMQRFKTLFEKRVIPRSNVDKALAVRDQARARRDAARARMTRQMAQIETALAQVEARQATLHERELDLKRTVIRSPVDGVVIDRNVDLGQTVAASLQAPVLFTIAQDLGRMQVEVSVDEADIGRIRQGQRVSFTVDAHPQRYFSGTVQQVRIAPTETANVVTYTVVVGTNNTDRALLPGMTANIEFVIGERKDVLRVSDTALRFTPASVSSGDTQAAGGNGGGGPEAARERTSARMQRLTNQLSLTPEQQQAVVSIFRDTGMAMRGLREAGLPDKQRAETIHQMRAQTNTRIERLLDNDQRKKFELILSEAELNGARRARLWTLDRDGKPFAIDIVSGISDGTNSEIVRGQIEEGAKVVVGVSRSAR